MAKKKRKRSCKHGVSKSTGKCLKRKRQAKGKKPYVTHACVIIHDKKTGKRKASKCGSGKASMKIFTAAVKAMHAGQSVSIKKTRTRR